jgi:hypothetical protein
MVMVSALLTISSVAGTVAGGTHPEWHGEAVAGLQIPRDRLKTFFIVSCREAGRCLRRNCGGGFSPGLDQVAFVGGAVAVHVFLDHRMGGVSIRILHKYYA